MEIVRISYDDARRIQNVVGKFCEGAHEILLGTGAKLVRYKSGSRYTYWLSGYHHSGKDVDTVIQDFQIDVK